ncbi:MAG: acetyl-CoA carboxylase subunit beta [Candidatus Raymondbacteria bacterium RifOxyA12_full_50_37]|uniref:Acetyl-coenzyme A carboxylase carboxyl transferase subunit beta n=1 Tax=Candidatus Raymondbacteria bacterium RIFOXYD12_FULL_49_13 TaxID=1817890 RepID=A0A1F7FDN0_UNCRA|nr:MAG: acetyl-CoA carboxylase subunit beta [Candidatus Raymondbacteria bacterium RifOxyA12_full_50_37]OGJ93552.1 MAG: acetyl-CoA carboxylase subunit beta [Candidatus Raymondbacteria bacterium RIFOXYA2_FULL_49_16]OGJ98822.1 MAG: acetyl-CoA carboxylase subunit beta [Candidatus Raymondbacteria bacterium RIFOXYC2_FULL_50_21]OGK02447.1 MAG: acetyl-CoA carboxylase subunit beta [Candidatus Raymondbacteria bacterium RifOxyB12_full_50_8]OGK04566.1 MAG: acetyl-CoA carboxylase subunit beta [Candidatus Ra
MEWFKKSKSGIVFQPKKEINDDLWLKCDSCKEIIYRKEVEKILWICPNCSWHFQINSEIYRAILIDQDSFKEIDRDMGSNDILKFKDKKGYADRIIEHQKKSGLMDAVVTGLGTMEKRPVAIGVMDFRYMGGSMGSVVGEKVTRLVRRATAEQLPLIIISSSGGARMQEGALSLMQMAKTSAALALHAEKKLPYISVLTHPTTGGTTASFAMLGDVHIAEPGALIGFAGPRVIRETIRQELPKGFQRAEFVLEHGFIDVICDRRNLKNLLVTLLNHFMGSKIPGQIEKSDDLFIDAQGNLKKKYQASKAG